MFSVGCLFVYQKITYNEYQRTELITGSTVEKKRKVKPRDLC